MRPRLAARGAGVLALALLALTLLLATPAKAFPTQTGWDRSYPAPGSGEFVIADFTGDGWTDLAMADPGSGKVWLYVGTALGLPQEPTASVAVPGIVALAAADLNGDGRTDLLAADGQNVLWLRDPPAFNLSTVLSAPGGAKGLAVGDLNGDGREDLAILGTRGVSVWYRTPSGGYPPEPAHVLSDNLTFDSLVAGDLDGDGRDDLAVAKAWELQVFRQGPSGLNLTAERYATGTMGMTAIGLVPTADAPLLAVVSDREATRGSGYLGLWRWSAPAFQLLASASGSYVPRFAVGDMNDDSRADLAVVTASGEISVFLQRNGSFRSVPDWTLTGPSPTDARVAIGDTNGDGFADLVVRVPGTLAVYFQEDAMPRLIHAIPTLVVNRGGTAAGVVDLRQFFADDHNRLTFAVTYASDPAHVAGTVDGDVLDVTAADWYGTAELRVGAWDGNANHARVESNAFTVLVNDVPRITSAPVRSATAGQAYTYLVAAADAFPVGDRATFRLLEGPDGMAIEPATGLLTWTPDDAQVGMRRVAVEVRDQNGGATVQAFDIVVAPAGADSPVLLMAVGVAASSAALLGAAALLNENAKYLFFVIVVPLYTKIKRERILDHFVRGQIFGYIQANPGEHYNAIKDALGLTNGSLAHHLRTLEREEFIKSKRFGLYRRFYPMNFRVPPDDAFQPNEVQTTILAVIRDRPGITQKEIADRLGLTPPTVNYHISLLSDRNLIRVERQGRSTHCTIVEGTQT